MELSGDYSHILGANLLRIDKVFLTNIQNEKLIIAFDALCQLGAQQLGLTQPLTSVKKLLNSETNAYLAWEYDSAKNVSRLLGYLKIGQKHLYLYDDKTNPYEGTFICLLDFYVHYQSQGRGTGTRLFNFMLENECIESPSQIPLDNPTPTLLRFFSKKFKLNDKVVQNNGFIVFKELFSDGEKCSAEEEKIPTGWIRSSTPRNIGIYAKNGTSASTRWLENAISGHSSAKKMQNRQGSPFQNQTAQEQASQRTNEAHKRKQQVLSNRPLW